MLYFYDIDTDYINYLKKVDPKVPDITYKSKDKFLCGAVLIINGHKFYAPISSNTKVFRTSFPIKDKEVIIATIRLSFMIPVVENVLKRKDFNLIKSHDIEYYNLLLKEWTYCNRHKDEILKKAHQVYKIGTNPNHKFHHMCCDFKKLEAAYIDKIYCGAYNKKCNRGYEA